jgi:hypothetical protein
MNTLLLFSAGFLIGFGVGKLVVYLIEPKMWYKIGIVCVDYEWRILYCREKRNGIKEFKYVKIQKYGHLPNDVIEKINSY